MPDEEFDDLDVRRERAKPPTQQQEVGAWFWIAFLALLGLLGLAVAGSFAFKLIVDTWK